MPRLIDGSPVLAPLSLGDTIEALDLMRFDPDEPGAWEAAMPLLAALSADRALLGPIAVAALAGRGAQGGMFRYGPQVLMLHESEAGWILRANLCETTITSDFPFLVP